MSIRKFFKSRQNNFVKLLLDQASLTLKGMELLKTYMDEHNPSVAQEIMMTEKEADEVRRILIDELLRTFVTPIDREDIFALSRAIDDVIDYANTTVDEMEILNVAPTPYMRRIASLLRDAAYEIHLRCCVLKIIRVWLASTPSGPRRWRTGWNTCTVRRWPICSAAPRMWSTWWRC